MIIISIIIVAAVQANAQNANNPKIAFEATTYDFDTIAQNSDGTHVFQFSNNGKSPLLITSAFSSCGCVVPEWPQEPIMPKQKASVKVKYNTSKLGHFTKVIIVKSNDPETPKTILRIHGTVVEQAKTDGRKL